MEPRDESECGCCGLEGFRLGYGQKRGLGRRTEVSEDFGVFSTKAWDKSRRR